MSWLCEYIRVCVALISENVLCVRLFFARLLAFWRERAATSAATYLCFEFKSLGCSLIDWQAGDMLIESFYCVIADKLASILAR